MLEIKIDNDYRIISCEHCFILQKKRIITGENIKGKQPKQENIGKEVWNDDGYYRTLRALFEDYARKKTLKSNAKTFQELFGILRDIENKIKHIIDVNNLNITN